MLVNYFKLKNISSRGRVIALSVVGGVFVLLLLFSIWQRNFSDTLIKYAPTDTDLYVHFSRPKINSAEKIDQIINNIFIDLALPDYESLDIDREVAVLGRLQNNQIQYGLIIKTNRPAKFKKLLTDAKLNYRPLTFNRFVVADQNWLETYQPDKNNFIRTNIAQRFHPLSSINIYVSSQFLATVTSDLNLNFVHLFLKNEHNDLAVSFKAKGDDLKMFAGGILSVVRSADEFIAQDLKPTIAGDLVLATTDAHLLLNNWQNNLKNISADDYQQFIASQLNTNLNTYLSVDNRQLFLVALKNGPQSGWLFDDYDFYISLENLYSEKVEEILKNIIANRYPIIKSVYLSDGTKVSELLPDPEQFSFVNKNGLKYLYAPDNQFILIYKSEGNNTIISNSESLINQNWPQFDGNYLRFNSSFLPDNSFTKYLKLFNVLEISERGIILK